MKPLPKDIAALLVSSPQPAPGTIRARVSSLVNADQDVLDALRGWARDENAADSKRADPNPKE